MGLLLDIDDELAGDRVREYRIHDSILRFLLNIAEEDRDTGWCVDIHEAILRGLVKDDAACQ